MEMRGIEPRAFHMQSERSTTELHPLIGLVYYHPSPWSPRYADGGDPILGKKKPILQFVTMAH